MSVSMLELTLLLMLAISSKSNPTPIKGCHPSDHQGYVHCSCTKTRESVIITEDNVTILLNQVPASTEQLKISGCFERIMNGSLFTNHSNLKTLDLSENFIIMLKGKVFANLEWLKELRLQGNLLTSFDPLLFNDTPQLEYLDISFNFFTSLEDLANGLHPLKNLNTLILESTREITSLGHDVFANFSDNSIKVVNLKYCKISKVSQNSLNSFRKLSSLDLSYNPLDLTAVKYLSVSLGYINLQKLILSHLKLVNIYPTFLFEYVSHTTIESIDLSYNYFPIVYPTKIAFHNLKILNLRFCNINTIADGAFNNFPNLESLDLKGNSIDKFSLSSTRLPYLKSLDVSNDETYNERDIYLEDYAFSNLSSLVYLDFHYLQINRKVRKNIFYNLPDLKTFILSRCGIKEIEDLAFETMTSLNVLDLQANMIETLTRDMFKGLDNLHRLLLSRNLITLKDPNYYFEFLPQLYLLTLDNNNLKYIPQRLTASLPNLLALTLAGNSIPPWEHRLFARNKLKNLFLSNNELFKVTSEMLEDFRDLNILDLSYNPFWCEGCEMYRFIIWINSTLTEIDYFNDSKSPTAYICTKPKGLNRTKIQYVQFPKDICIFEGENLILFVTLPIALLGIGLGIVSFYFRGYLRYCALHARVEYKKYRKNTLKDNFLYDAFVSYTIEDNQWVRQRLIPKLETEMGFKLFIIEKHIQPGVPITDASIEALKNSRKTLIILSQAYLSREASAEEMEVVEHRILDTNKDSLILVKLGELDEASVSKIARYLITTRTYLEWKSASGLGGRKAFWEKLNLALLEPQNKERFSRIV